MLAILSLVTPIFGLIALGFVSVRTGWLEKAAARALTDFAFKIAMPALLFRSMAQVGIPAASPLLLIGTYTSAVSINWLLATVLTSILLRRPAADAPAIAMGSCFSNGVMLGIPLILGALGPEAATPIAFTVSIESTLLWVIATLHMELVSRAAGPTLLESIGGIIWDLVRNPIVASILLGIAWAASGLAIPSVPDKLLALLAQSAAPVSLFALGMSLASFPLAGQLRTTAMMCVLKLAFYPALVFVFASRVFELPPLWTAALLLFTSMPVGANAFVFASRYERAIGSVSAAVAVSTAISVLSISVVLAVLQQLGMAQP